MSDSTYDFAKQTDAINGYFKKDYNLSFTWFPQYIDEFPKAIHEIKLNWEKCKFVPASIDIIPDDHGVYCFSIPLRYPLPSETYVPLYIGKAAPQFLSERFGDYLKEKKNPKGRSKIVNAFNKYQNNIEFWWSVLKRSQVESIEEHLLMCYCPPCNTSIPNRQRLWGKAF